MSGRRPTAIGLGATALLAIIAVIAGGLSTVTPRTFALGVPSRLPVATLSPHRTVCEGAVSSPRPFSVVSIWGGAAQRRPAAVIVSVHSAGNDHVLASGRTVVGSTASDVERRASMSRRVGAQEPVRICVTGLRGRFTLFGDHVVAPDLRMTLRGSQVFALLLLGSSQTFLGSLPTIFSRAALFRPSWVGPWTFWLLAAALLVTFALAVIAIAQASRAQPAVLEEGRPPSGAGPAGRTSTDPA